VVTIRPASASDEALILDWANDPDTRAASFRVEPIAPEAHHSWFIRHLREPDQSRIWIGLRNGRPVGIVRVDRESDGTLGVSVGLDRTERGHGRSRPLLEAGLAAARLAFPGARFRAWIRPTNHASLALFQGAGFTAPQNRPILAPGAPPDVVVLERD
jgi:RimJ/RimL family protein N-acetyltransferase